MQFCRNIRLVIIRKLTWRVRQAVILRDVLLTLQFVFSLERTRSIVLNR